MVRDCVDHLKKQLNECQVDLLKQSESYAVTNIPLQQLDERLKDFVHFQQKHAHSRSAQRWMTWIGRQRCEKLYEDLLHHRLTLEQVSVHSFAKHT
jgi:hypothetical protein